MSISLVKGQKISLSKESQNLSKVVVGLGWDPTESGANADLDAFALMLNDDGKLYDVVAFYNRDSKDKSIHHTGDNLTGEGDGDDEQLIINLPKVANEVKTIIFGVCIYEAFKRKQSFDMIENSFIRLVDGNANKEICKYNLKKDFTGKAIAVLGKVYRHNNEWKFSAEGNGYADIDSIKSFAKSVNDNQIRI